MPTDRTTVVIATRDRCTELLETLRRLLTLDQEHPIIVVDNASRDGTFVAVQSLRDTLDRLDRLRPIRLRRPLRSAVRRSVAVVGSAPKDVATLGAVADALRGALWVIRHRQVVPDRVEYGLILLEEDQKRSPARRCIG